MRISTAKDLILLFITDKKNIMDLSTWNIHQRLKLSEDIVNTALFELQDEKLISLLKITDTQNGLKNRWIINGIDSKAYYFVERKKKFRSKAFWSAVKEFIKSYWVVIGFVISIGIAIYQSRSKADYREENQAIQLKINQLTDSLNSLQKK